MPLALIVAVWAARGEGTRVTRIGYASIFLLGCAVPVIPLAWHNAAYDEMPEVSYALEVTRPTAERATAGETLRRIVTGHSAPLGWADGVNRYLGNVPSLRDVNRNDHVEHFDRYQAIIVEPWRGGKWRASEHAAWFRAATWKSIAEAPGAWAALFGRKIAETINGYEVARGTTPYADRESSRVLSAVLWTRRSSFRAGCSYRSRSWG